MQDKKKKSSGKIGIYFDTPLLVMILFMVMFGLVMVYSTSSYTASIDFDGDKFHYLKKQTISAAIGLVFMAFTTLIPFTFYKNKIIAWVAYGFGIFMITLVLSPLGGSGLGATRWVYVAGFSIQPAEIVKISTIILTASVLSRMTREELQGWKSVAWTLIPAGISAGMILFITNNFSSALIIGGIAFFMLIATTGNNWRPFVVLGAFALIIGFCFLCIYNGWFSSFWSFRGGRVLAWLNPEAHYDEKGFQVVQGLYGIGSGGVFGKGLGKSVQKLGFLPEASNDMIFSIICEELGLFGAIGVLIVYSLILFRIKDLSKYVQNSCANLMLVGVFTHIALQVILNVAVVTNTIPNTGISLPFISYGGSSILCLLTEMGFVFSASLSANFYTHHFDETRENEQQLSENVNNDV